MGGSAITTGLISLEVDSVLTCYAPIDPSQADLGGDFYLIHTYRLVCGSTTSSDAKAKAKAMKDRGGSFAIYLPAGSLEDLEPKNMLQ